jgi:hypothetical protein
LPPAEGSFLEPFFISIQWQAAPLAVPHSYSDYFPPVFFTTFNLFFSGDIFSGKR